jgi:energy-coupling factor transporter ATP-binding protein EcfA2
MDEAVRRPGAGFALLVGSSGCGKSTLARCVGGLVPHFSGGALRGKLSVGGHDPIALGPGGRHEEYDLKRCFEIGWDAGFRGPWCLEHFNTTLDGLWRGFGQLREMLRGWMKA